MKKHLELFKEGFDLTVAEKTEVKNWPYVGYSPSEGVVFTVIPEPVVGPANNEIWYTSSDNNIVTPYDSSVFGANIVSNTYKDGKGVIIFDRDVTSIGKIVFHQCNTLTSIIIPNSVTSIGSNTFSYCDVLTSINVDVNNPNYCSIDGVLFNKDITTLIQYPIGNTRTEYTIPNNVTTIGVFAFYACKYLISITIPNSVTRIENDAFYDCSFLTSITFEGTIEEWNNIIKKDGWCFKTALKTIHCTNGDVEI